MILRLPLTTGSFTVLFEDTRVQTCYTDSAGTSRSAFCAPAAFADWAQAALAALSNRRDQCPNQAASSCVPSSWGNS